MTELINLRTIHLRIDSEGHTIVDIQVGEQWRRVIKTFHSDYTDYYAGGLALVVDDETKDVTAEYQEYQEGES